MPPVVGKTDSVQIEFELEDPRDEQWLFGRFRLRMGGKVLGDWDDVVTLRAVTSWWQSFVDDDARRWEPRLDGLDCHALFRLLTDSVYGDEPEGGVVEDAYSRYHVNHLGMSAFDRYVVLLVEPPGKGQRLLWGGDRACADVHEAWLPDRTLQEAGREFIAAMAIAQESNESRHHT